ncbi:MAG: DUF5687 family protein [Polaribacter sp.]|nr:DUF5687 family protein [Polaribacter sp.]
MIRHFLRLEWKQYFRSSYWQKGIALKIIMGFFALYMLLTFLAMGFFSFRALKKFFPESDPLQIVNSYLIFVIVADLIFRYMMQKMPVMNIKPLLILPIQKSKLVHYVLGKSAFSFFNVMGLFFYIPFSVVLIGEGYDANGVLAWLFSMILIIQATNFLNFLINKNNKAFWTLVVVLLGGFALKYFNLFDLGAMSQTLFDGVVSNPIMTIIPLGILLLLYRVNYSQLKSQVYLDAAVSVKTKEASTADLSWTKRFGDVAPFIQLDLKLLWRNKRAKSTLPVLALGLLYGLFFYPQPMYKDMVFMYAFIGIFSTGAFLINFGQFIPAWDSGYYSMLMSQNFKYRQYLRSKFTLMTISVVLLFVLGIPYVYFGWKILITHFAAAIYNVGVNTHVILYGGAFNRKRINLEERAAFNLQGTGAVQWLIGIPLMALPMGIFGLFNWLVNFETAIAVLIGLGTIGIVFHQKIMTVIIRKYAASKYKMIHAFNQTT